MVVRKEYKVVAENMVVPCKEVGEVDILVDKLFEVVVGLGHMVCMVEEVGDREQPYRVVEVVDMTFDMLILVMVVVVEVHKEHMVEVVVDMVLPYTVGVMVDILVDTRTVEVLEEPYNMNQNKLVHTKRNTETDMLMLLLLELEPVVVVDWVLGHIQDVL